MATRVIDDTKLNDIAVAIQAKDSGGQMTVDEMPTRITNIPSGGTLIPKTITENGVYNASSDSADGYDVVTVDVPEKNTLDELLNGTLNKAYTTAVTIPPSFFRSTRNVLEVEAPNCTTIGSYCFYASDVTPTLKKMIAPNVTDIGENAFGQCRTLENFILNDDITIIKSGCFTNCVNYSLQNLPSNLITIESAGFSGCESITITKLPSKINSLGNNAFNKCNSIPFLDMSDVEGVPSIGTTSFNNTTFPFYFRGQQQLDDFAAATNWSTYADRFQIKPSGVI